MILLTSQFFNESTSPYTTALLHPDGAFFALLCLFSWCLFFVLWASTHKPRPPKPPPKTKLPKNFDLHNWRN